MRKYTLVITPSKANNPYNLAVIKAETLAYNFSEALGAADALARKLGLRDAEVYAVGGEIVEPCTLPGRTS
jgi:hypothetical protein